MSYQGFIRPLCRGFISKFPFPKILEIGVDKGNSTIPLIQNLTSINHPFLYVGVDIFLRHEVIEIVSQFEKIKFFPEDPPSEMLVNLVEENSLFFLEETLKNKNELPLATEKPFDIVFVDGDHNYYTVIRELNMIRELINPAGAIVVDDFHGRWADRDLFYADREEYKDNKIATQKSDKNQSQKQGVKTAVMDFLRENPEWQGWTHPDHEPVILFRRDVYNNPALMPEESLPLRNKVFMFSYSDEFKKILESGR